MADTQNITDNLLDMYGRNDLVMRLNFKCFMKLSGLDRLPRDASILDLGCAMGHLIITLNSFGFRNVKGLDAAPDMVEAARKLTGAEIILADAVNVGSIVTSESFDCIIISDLFHHIPSSGEWLKMLAGARAALKPGGLLLIREPFPTLPVRIIYAMSKIRAFHIGFMKARLQSFVEEDELLQYFFKNWVPNYRDILAGNGFTIERDLNWLVHRITSARKNPA